MVVPIWSMRCVHSERTHQAAPDMLFVVCMAPLVCVRVSSTGGMWVLQPHVRVLEPVFGAAAAAFFWVPVICGHASAVAFAPASGLQAVLQSTCVCELHRYVVGMLVLKVAESSSQRCSECQGRAAARMMVVQRVLTINKKKHYNTGSSRVITYPITNPAQTRLSAEV
jgi:hypothetical protein